jgi:hypothetical protein
MMDYNSYVSAQMTNDWFSRDRREIKRNQTDWWIENFGMGDIIQWHGSEGLFYSRWNTNQLRANDYNVAANAFVRNWEKEQREENKEKLQQGTVEIGKITYTLAIGEGNNINPHTLGRNIAGTNYVGNKNVQTESGESNFGVPPRDASDLGGAVHDIIYGNRNLEGAGSLLFDPNGLDADAGFIFYEHSVTQDPSQPLYVQAQAAAFEVGMFYAILFKLAIYSPMRLH